MSNRAWVTLATNDSYGLGALVLAHSLRRAGSAYPAVVLITPSVTDAMRDRLGAVFAEVIAVDVLDSRDPTHLALLQRPELGITFTKIHCWSLTQYEKCVFLDADTLIIQNCDELFEREELSAAPDVGWPDCFNSGVFVFAPSADTYSRLIAFAQERGSFDGGDQGLLNAFFSDWAQGDINRHLPFLYNVTSAAFYSYIPALKHYGQNLKIIHFIGPAKPWLQRYNWQSNTVEAAEHLRDFLQLWWNIFTGLVHNQLDTTMEPPVEVGPDEELPPESPPKDVQEYYAPKLDPQSKFPWHHPDAQNKQTDANDSNLVKSKFYDPWENYHGSAPPHEVQATYSTSHDENYKESTWNQPPLPYQAQAQETANCGTMCEQYQPQHYEHKQEEHYQQDTHDHYQSHHDHTQHHQDHSHHDHGHTQGPSYAEESHHHSAHGIEWHHGHQSQEVSFQSYQQVHSYESHKNTHYPDSHEHAHSNEHTKHKQHGYHDYSIHKQHHTPEQHNISEQHQYDSHHQHHTGSKQFSQPSQNYSFQESNQVHIHDSHVHQEHYHDYNKKETPALAFNQPLNQSDGQKNKEYGYVPINYEPVQRKRLQHVYYLHMDHRPKSNRRRKDNRVYLSSISQEMTNGHISEEEDDDFRPRHPYDGFYLRHRPTIDARGHKVCSHEIPPTPSPSPSPPPLPRAPSPPLRTSSPAASDEYISASDGEGQTGVAGNLARVVPGESGYQREALDDLTRRQGWEAGNIDYMGADSFDNIWAKISQTLSQPKQPSPPRKEPTPPKEPSPPKEKSQETSAPAESVDVPKPVETPVIAPAPVAKPVTEKPAEIAEPLPEPFLAICPAKPESPSEPPKSEPATELPKVVEEVLVAESAPKDALAPAAAEKTEPSVPATPPATPKSTPEASMTPVSELPLQLDPVSEPTASAASEAVATPVQPAEATPEKAIDSSTLTATSTDSPPLVNTPSKEETPAVSPTKLEERRKVAPAGRLQLSAPAPPDPLPTPDSELEDAAALAQSIIASEIAVTAPTPLAAPTSPPLRQQQKSLSVEEPEVPTPPVSLAQIGVKPKAKLTTAAQIEKSVAEKEASAPSTPTTPSEPGTPTSDPKKKLVKKAPKKEGGVSGEATTPVPPPRKKEKKPKEK